jgi:FkbM family methyltransferase
MIMGRVSFLKKWSGLTHEIDKYGKLKKFFRAIRINKLLLGLHQETLKWLLTYKYGWGFRKSSTGEISVHGTKFKFFDPSFWYLSNAMFGQNHEPAVTYHMKTTIGNKKLCFLDIGAYYGYFTAYVGALNKNCEIYSFEPNKNYYQVCRENVSLNNINSKVFDVALSDEKMDIPFADRSMKVSDGKNFEVVPSMPFDDLRNKEEIYPDVVKIDVHGGEGKVLFGMKKSLNNDISHIYCELHEDRLLVDYSTKDILDLLFNSGYDLFEIEGFRKETSPKFNDVNDVLYDNLINDGKKGIFGRMIYAKKSS